MDIAFLLQMLEQRRKIEKKSKSDMAKKLGLNRVTYGRKVRGGDFTLTEYLDLCRYVGIRVIVVEGSVNVVV